MVIVVTSSHIHGKRIVKTLGMVRGNTVRSRHIGKDILALLRNLVGGEIQEYTKMLAEAREQALDRMMHAAERLGGNAVVDVRFGTAEVMSAAAEIIAYGTAGIVADVHGGAARKARRRRPPGERGTMIDLENLGQAIGAIGVLLLIVAAIALPLFTSIWAYGDAERRGKSGCLVAILVFFLSWPLGLILWIVFRPEPPGYRPY